MSGRTPAAVGRSARAVVVALIAVLVLTSCSSGKEGSTETDTLPAPMPDITLAGFADQPDRNLAEIDRPTLVSLWASWCKPCRDEMPVLEEFHQKYQDRVDVLGIDFQDPRSEVAKDLVASSGVTYPLVTDFEGDIDGLKPFPRVAGLPMLAFVDGEGRLVAVEYVLFDNLAELEKIVESHLDLGGDGSPDAGTDDDVDTDKDTA